MLWRKTKVIKNILPNKSGNLNNIKNNHNISKPVQLILTQLARTCKESAVSSLFNRLYSIITNENELTKENATMKQVLERMDIKKALLVKSLRESLTIIACLSHNKKRSHRCSRGRDQIEYKFNIHWRYQLKNTAYTQQTHFLH